MFHSKLLNTMKTILPQEKENQLGIGKGYSLCDAEYKELVNYTNLKLATLGLPTVGDQSDNPSLEIRVALWLRNIVKKFDYFEDTYAQLIEEFRTF